MPNTTNQENNPNTVVKKPSKAQRLEMLPYANLLRQNGYSYREIESATGMSKTTIHKLVSPNKYPQSQASLQRLKKKQLNNLLTPLVSIKASDIPF